MEFICPKCRSPKILPLYAKSQIWKCEKCGYIGKPQKIDPHMKDFWESYKQISSKQ